MAAMGVRALASDWRLAMAWVLIVILSASVASTDMRDENACALAAQGYVSTYEGVTAWCLNRFTGERFTFDSLGGRKI